MIDLLNIFSLLRLLAHTNIFFRNFFDNAIVASVIEESGIALLSEIAFLTWSRGYLAKGVFNINYTHLRH